MHFERPAGFDTPTLRDEYYAIEAAKVREEIVQDVDDTLNKIYQQQQSIEDEFEMHVEWVSLVAEYTQLQKMSDIVLNLSETEAGDPIHLNDLSLVDGVIMPSADFFEAYFSESIKAIGLGEARGAAKFLGMLAPYSIEDLSTSEECYSAMPRQTFINTHGATEQPDGSIRHALATRIPNIEIVYYYASDSDLPRRVLRLKENRLKESTQSSSLR